MRARLGRDVTLTLVTSLVLSRLDYCNSVHAGLPASILAPLQRVLHAAARLVNGLRPHDHVSPTLKELHWLPIKQRVDYKLCLLVYKVVVGHAPSYLTSCMLTTVTDVPSRSTLRDASSRPQDPSEIRREGVLRRCPSSMEPVDNRIQASFQALLKTFLFQPAYCCCECF